MYHEHVPGNQPLFEAGRHILLSCASVYLLLALIISSIVLIHYQQLGSMGTTFYIILKGKVGVIIKLPKPGKNELEPTEVAQIPAGASFGELSLMEKVLKPRAATIFCKEDCHFAVLDKQRFQEILGKAEKKKLDEQLDFLISTHLFGTWSINSLKPVVYLFKKQKYTKGTIVYKEGQSSNELFVIREGEVKLTKRIFIQPNGQEEVILDEKSQVYSFQRQALQKTAEVLIFAFSADPLPACSPV